MNGSQYRPAVMSVDVEDWFQVENLRAAVSRESWDTRERRVVANTQRLLSVFDRTGVTGTFFCLGWVAEQELVRPQSLLELLKK